MSSSSPLFFHPALRFSSIRAASQLFLFQRLRLEGGLLVFVTYDTGNFSNNNRSSARLRLMFVPRFACSI